MNVRRLLTAALLAATLAGPAGALEPEERLDDPALEARARAVTQSLRCVVCQNQSIDDSDARVAADMRRLVRERIVAGDSDDQVRDRLVAAYGEFVLLAPKASGATLLIWLAPALTLGLGLIWARRRLARPGAAVVGEADAPPPLDAAEEARLEARLRALSDER